MEGEQKSRLDVDPRLRLHIVVYRIKGCALGQVLHRSADDRAGSGDLNSADKWNSACVWLGCRKQEIA